MLYLKIKAEQTVGKIWSVPVLVVTTERDSKHRMKRGWPCCVDHADQII